MTAKRKNTKKRIAKKSAKVTRKSAAKRTGAKTARSRAKVGGSSDQKSASERIDEKIAMLGDWRGASLARIRKLIHQAHPGVVEEWKWMGSPVWSHEGIFVVGNAHKDKVKLTFSHGAKLADPDRLFNAGLDGKQWRAIDLHEHDKIATKAFKALVREAVAHNVKTKTAKKKPSTKTAKVAKKVPARPVASKPKLLSGGNPQIAKADGDTPVQAYIAAMPEWKQDVGSRLDALIVRTVPNVQKAVRWNSPFYGIDGQGWFLSYHCFAKYLKVTFLNGASLHPPPPVESKHDAVRYFHIHENDQIDEELVASWISQASKLPGEALF